MTISREPNKGHNRVNVEPSDARVPHCYTPPKLEKMQQLAQVTGAPAMTGSV